MISPSPFNHLFNTSTMQTDSALLSSNINYPTTSMMVRLSIINATPSLTSLSDIQDKMTDLLPRNSHSLVLQLSPYNTPTPSSPAPLSSTLPSSTLPTNITRNTTWHLESEDIILLITIPSLVLFVMVIVVLCICKRNRNRQSKDTVTCYSKSSFSTRTRGGTNHRRVYYGDTTTGTIKATNIGSILKDDITDNPDDGDFDISEEDKKDSPFNKVYRSTYQSTISKLSAISRPRSHLIEYYNSEINPIKKVLHGTKTTTPPTSVSVRLKIPGVIPDQATLSRLSTYSTYLSHLPEDKDDVSDQETDCQETRDERIVQEEKKEGPTTDTIPITTPTKSCTSNYHGSHESPFHNAAIEMMSSSI